MTTYTSNLGLQLQVPGDPAVKNAWGTNLNTNFSLIDNGVSGLLSLSVAGASNVVLTNVNGAASQSRNAVFVFTGVLTGNIDVLFPAGVTKLFAANNLTSAAFSLSIGVNNGSGSPAGSVAVLPTSESGLFYSDGTNVFAVGFLSPGTTGSGPIVLQSSPTIGSPDIIGTATGPDSGTWGSSGINNIAQLGALGPIGVGGYTPGQNGFELGVVGSALLTGPLTAGAAGTNAWGTLGSLSSSVAFVKATTSGGSGVANLAVYLGSSFSSQFNTDGSFTVGSSTPAGAGAIAATGNITAFYSDERLKTRIGRVENAVEKIMSLSAFYYHANDLAKERSNGVYDPAIREVGLSAQEVRKILPEVVAPAPFDHEFLTLKYERIVTLLVAGVQEQQGEIRSMRLAMIVMGVAIIGLVSVAIRYHL